ncbi:hypothetical protein BO82DRAFT_167039 [Aspergillus uvarum CBS 121591]|uniref:Uncharacterized protein n=1 Tax=Aspergillus uvarum CBS 121591 TaxID=1448315 RepID=A0A319DE18_9EURO|nr:hypothetical protein BO82DRAFT_167039 [Aspergillus uvarum CBS 121591]PYH78052.1 hypothetical protein BO82DRAFT_167039 [Aspergillus uvarum CBS 121591]
MIRAKLVDKPDYRVGDLDVVGCGSTLGNILRFARGDTLPFRMLVEAIGHTVFLIRMENSPWDKDAWESESHQRLINYQFANMNVLVRFEADGFLPDLIPEPGIAAQENSSPGEKHMDSEDLLSSIAAATISTNQAPVTTDDRRSSALEISQCGRHSPQCAIFDLKTRSGKTHDFEILQEQMHPRLWIRQTPRFLLACHNAGRFEDIRVLDVREDLEQ